MSIPAQSGAVATTWASVPLATGSMQYTCVLAASSDVSSLLEVYPFAIDTIHIFGTFNASNISVLATNSLDSNANGQVLHRADAPASTLSAVAAEVMATVLEVPRFIYAKANGAVTSVTVVVVLINRWLR